MEPKSIDRIFWDAAQIAAQAERDRYLDSACADDGELRRRVENLLQARSKAESFLESPALDPVATLDERPVSEGPGTVIGPYRLMEEIGEGGMGLVFVAQQQHPIRRKVALKVIKPGMATRQVVARFEAERQALALMDHPNIAKVFDGGESASGRPYFVMELVKGVPITKYCDDNCLTPRERLELFGQVCQAVQHAHQKGVIHRDLKPSNVLVMSQDGVPLVKVIDFGVAKAIGQQLTDKTVYTQFAQLVGTPLYMSPEQAGQSGLDVDTRTDIYALGVLLYELLTGTTPFDEQRLRAAEHDEMRRIIREEEPPRPSTRIGTLGLAANTVSMHRKSDPKRLSQLCRGELDWIVMKALEKDRNRRYETAGTFAADVQRYLDDEPVQACPASRWYRLRKHRGAAVTATAFVGLLLAGAAVSTVLAVWAVDAERDALAGWADAERKGEAAAEARQKAVADRIRAEQAEAEAKREAAKADAVKTFLLQGVLGWAAVSVGFPDQSALVGTLDEASRNLDQLFAAQPEAEAAVRLTVGELYYSVGLRAKAEPHLRRGLLLRRATRKAPLDPLKAEDAETLYAMKHLGTLLKDRGDLAAAEPFLRLSEGALRCAEMRRIPCAVPDWTINVLSVAFSPDSRRVLAGGDDACMRLYDVASGIEVHCFVGSWVCSFSPDGRRILAGGDKTLRLWDAATAKELRQFKGHTDGVSSVVFSPDGRQALSGSNDKTIRLWDLETGAQVRRFQGHTAAVMQAVYTPDGRRVLSGSEDGTVRLWDVATGEQVRQFQERRTAVWSVAVSPDGRRALSMDSGAVLLWDVETGKEIRRFQGPGPFGWVVFAADGHRALRTDHFQRKLRLWDVDTGKDLKCFSVETPLRPQKAVISPDGRLAACGNWRGSVSLWRLADPLSPAQALVEARQGLKSARRDRGPEHADTLAALHDLGALLWVQGKLAEAEPLFRESLATKRCTLGPDHPESLFALRELAALLQAQKKAAAAEPLVRQYVAGTRRALGPDHPDALVALADLCTLLQDQGRVAEAEPLWRQRWDGWRRLQDPESSEGRGALRGLTGALLYLGKAAEVETLYREVLERRRRTLLAADPRITQALCLWGISLIEKGDAGRAVEALREAVQIQRKHGAEGDREVTGTEVALGWALTENGQAKEAEPILRKCLEARRKDLPKAHWLTANAESLLGGCLTALKRYEEAEPLLLHAHADLRAASKTPPPRLRQAGERIVRLYQAWDKKDKADHWRQKLEEAKRAAKPPARGK
jgi:serine/threonine protein kinase/tetratricopeptide (TPR) repeat protein